MPKPKKTSSQKKSPCPKKSPNQAKLWRKLDLRKETRDELLEDVIDWDVDVKPSEGNGVPAKIVVLGPTGAGKSSTVNSIVRVVAEDLTVTSNAGPKSTASTKQLLETKVFAKDSGRLRFHLVDCPGFTVGNSAVDIEGYKKIILGKTCKTKSVAHTEHQPHQVKTETHKSQDHVTGVIFVQHITHKLLPKVKEQIETVLEFLNSLSDVPYIVILTHTDTLEPNLNKILSNANVKVFVDEAGKQYSSYTNRVFPAVNYSNDDEMDVEMDVLLLHALKTLLQDVQRRIKALKIELVVSETYAVKDQQSLVGDECDEETENDSGIDAPDERDPSEATPDCEQPFEGSHVSYYFSGAEQLELPVVDFLQGESGMQLKKCTKAGQTLPNIVPLLVLCQIDDDPSSDIDHVLTLTGGGEHICLIAIVPKLSLSSIKIPEDIRSRVGNCHLLSHSRSICPSSFTNTETAKNAALFVQQIRCDDIQESTTSPPAATAAPHPPHKRLPRSAKMS